MIRPVLALGIFDKKCEFCGRKTEGAALERYTRSFCSSEHVASYFGAYVEESWDEVYWSDFY